jgi:hypothetical protein
LPCQRPLVSSHGLRPTLRAQEQQNCHVVGFMFVHSQMYSKYWKGYVSQPVFSFFFFLTVSVN